MRIGIAVIAAMLACNTNSPSAYSQSATLLNDAEPAITPQQTADARVALEAMALSLRAVRSGTCRIRCRYQYDPNERGEGKHLDTGENIFIAFDKAQGLYRYDDLETKYYGHPNQVIVRPDLVIRAQAEWKTGGPSGFRAIVRRTPSEAKNIYQHHRDPFLTVLINCRENDIGLTHAGVLDRFLDETLPSARIVSFKRQDSELVNIRVIRESIGLKAKVEYDLVLNSAQKYVPVRVLIRHTATKSRDWSNPDVIENQWIQINGVFVPKRSHSIGTFSRKSNLTFDMDWKSVNEPLHPALFSEEAFALQRGNLVINAKGNEHVVEKIVGVELPKLPPKQPDPPPRRLRFALILLANAFVVGALFYVFRRRRGTLGGH